MPVQVNIAIGTQGLVAWDGAAATEHDVRKWTRHGFTFRVTADITADTVFTFEEAAPDPADNCSPGAFSAITEPPLCEDDALGVTPGQVTIPAGTPAGTVFGGALRCRHNAFIRPVAGAGDVANVQVVMLLQGPKMA